MGHIGPVCKAWVYQDHKDLNPLQIIITTIIIKWFQTLAIKMFATSSTVQGPRNIVLYPRKLESKVVLISRCVQGAPTTLN
jgi:hypothetical protein